MTKTEVSPRADAKTPDEDKKLIETDDTVEKNKENGEKKTSKFSIFRTKTKKERNFDDEDEDETIDCVSKVIGSYGPWQRKFVIFYMFLYLISPFHNYGIIFFKAESDFWCTDFTQNMTTDERALILNKCVPGCKSYEYDRSTFYRTIVNEWDLVCDKSYYASAAASSYQVGYAISSILVGFFSDRYGRAPTFKSMVFFEILAGYGQAFAPSIYFFMISRIILGIVAYGRFSTGLLLIMEIVGPTKRASYSVFVEFSYYFGHFVLIGFFYWVPDFRYVQFTVTTMQIAALFYLHLVPESIRWNIVKGRHDAAREDLRTAAQLKYPNLDPVTLEARVEKLISHFELEGKKEQGKKKQTILDLWAIPSMLKLCLILYLCWFCNHLIGYSAVFNATNFGSLYVSMAGLTVANLGASLVLFLIIERFNRKTLAILSYGFIITSCLCLAVSFRGEHGAKAVALNSNSTLNSTVQFNNNVNALNAFRDKFGINLRNISIAPSRLAKPKQDSNFTGIWRLWLGMILKFTVSICFHTIYVLSVESFPTIIRQLSAGTCSLASRFATILSPFTKELSEARGKSFLYSLFTTLAICSCTAIFFVSETRGKEIPDTIEDCVKRAREESKNKRTQSSGRTDEEEDAV